MPGCHTSLEFSKVRDVSSIFSVSVQSPFRLPSYLETARPECTTVESVM